MTTEQTPAVLGCNEGLGPALEDAAYDCLSALAGVETYDVNLRDHPEAWAAIEAFATKVRAAERERYDELFAAYNEACAISSRRAAAVDAIVSHWREFGPEHGLDEVIERAAAAVGRA